MRFSLSAVLLVVLFVTIVSCKKKNNDSPSTALTNTKIKEIDYVHGPELARYTFSYNSNNTIDTIKITGNFLESNIRKFTYTDSSCIVKFNYSGGEVEYAYLYSNTNGMPARIIYYADTQVMTYNGQELATLSESLYGSTLHYTWSNGDIDTANIDVTWNSVYTHDTTNTPTDFPSDIGNFMSYGKSTINTRHLIKKILVHDNPQLSTNWYYTFDLQGRVSHLMTVTDLYADTTSYTFKY